MTAAVPGEAVAGEPFGVAIVGCGNISKQYLKNLATFPDVRVLFCADIDVGRAKAQAAAYGVPASGSPEQALEHPDVQLVVNLTIPAAHAEVASVAIAAEATSACAAGMVRFTTSCTSGCSRACSTVPDAGTP